MDESAARLKMEITPSPRRIDEISIARSCSWRWRQLLFGPSNRPGQQGAALERNRAGTGGAGRNKHERLNAQWQEGEGAIDALLRPSRKRCEQVQFAGEQANAQATTSNRAAQLEYGTLADLTRSSRPRRRPCNAETGEKNLFALEEVPRTNRRGVAQVEPASRDGPLGAERMRSLLHLESGAAQTA